MRLQIFLRNDVLFTLDSAALEVRVSAAVVIQAWLRSFLQHKWYQDARVAAVHIQRVARGRLGRMAARDMVDTLQRNRRRAALRHEVEALAASRAQHRDSTRRQLMAADARLRTAYEVMDLHGAPLLVPPRWQPDGDRGREDTAGGQHPNAMWVELDVGVFEFTPPDAFGMPADGLDELHHLHADAVQALAEALTALAQYEAAEVDTAAKLDAMAPVHENSIDDLQKRRRVIGAWLQCSLCTALIDLCEVTCVWCVVCGVWCVCVCVCACVRPWLCLPRSLHQRAVGRRRADGGRCRSGA